MRALNRVGLSLLAGIIAYSDSPVRADFVGQSLNVSYYAPTLDSPPYNPQTQTIAAAGTTFSNVNNFDLTVTGSTVTASSPYHVYFNGGIAQNGPVLTQLTGGAISHVAVDSATNMAGFDASSVFSTYNKIIMNWGGLSISPSTIVKLDVQFSDIYHALTNPAQTLNFDDLSATAHDAPVTSLDGVTFSNFYNSEVDATGAFGPNDPNFIGNFQSKVPVTPNSYISFAAPVDQAAFRLFSQTGTTTFTAYLNDQIVGRYSASTGTNLSNYYGFQGITFDKIGISTVSSDNAFLVDDLQFGSAAADPAAAPLPSTVWAGLGLLGCLGALKLRRKRATA